MGNIMMRRMNYFLKNCHLDKKKIQRYRIIEMISRHEAEFCLWVTLL